MQSTTKKPTSGQLLNHKDKEVTMINEIEKKLEERDALQRATKKMRGKLVTNPRYRARKKYRELFDSLHSRLLELEDDLEIAGI